MFNIRTVALIFGVTFVLVGIIGFVPNPLVSPSGIFAVNAMHNLVHVLTGLAFIGGVLLFSGKEGLVVISIGVAYMAVAILGFFTTGDMLLGIVHINEADRWLHLGLAIAILLAGFIFKPAPVPTPSRVRN